MILSNEIINKYIDEAKMFKNRLININDDIDISRNVTPSMKGSLLNTNLTELNTNVLRLYQYIYLHNLTLEDGIKPIVNNNNLQNINSFKSFKEELERIEHDLLKTKLKNKYPTSSFYIVNDFQDSNSNSRYLLNDPKTNLVMNFNQICNGSKQTLTLNEVSNLKIKPKEIYIKNDECNCHLWEMDNLYNLTDENKNFRCVVRKKRTNVFSNVDMENSAALLTIVFDFKNIRKLNSLKINENSISKMILEKDDIRFWNVSKKRYESITNSSDYIDGNLVFFNTIETSKIKITLKQLAFLDINQNYDSNALPVDLRDQSNKDDSYYYYYDMSISEIEFYYSVYRSQSIYRSNLLYGFNKPQSISFEENYLFYDNSTMIEKYLYVITYGDKETMFLNEKGVSIRDFSRAKPSFEGILPITNDYIYSEIALPSFFKDNYAYCKLTFIPNISTLRLNNEVIDLFNSKGEQITTISDFTAGLYYLKIPNYSYTKSYLIDYEIDTSEKCILTNGFSLENGSIIVPETLQESIGFIQPIIIMRNKSNFNDSTKVIKNYGLIVEEKEVSNNIINYDIFIAETKGV
ncbi:hypothetical protein UFOVP724_148 [uncultured Caudovirales phage]|uniref:Uncharacterized protein n=1 Tax=uncultured Caudovirales phage TaxID=2100421 RepID=A0A6J5NSP5_9CAUD|nr:hypothetical protein UFOVP724_148 [uncultured Caudovirales phage]